MSKRLTYTLTVSGLGTLDPNVLHDALLADVDYVSWKGTWVTDDGGYYKDPLLMVEHDDANVYLTVPDATNETTLLSDVDAQRI